MWDGGAIQLKVSEKQIQFAGTLEPSQLAEDKKLLKTHKVFFSLEKLPFSLQWSMLD